MTQKQTNSVWRAMLASFAKAEEAPQSVIGGGPIVPMNNDLAHHYVHTAQPIAIDNYAKDGGPEMV